eukprot:2290979-Pyramimonas_sp.AAC.1
MASDLKCQAFTKQECMSTWFFAAAKYVPRLVDSMMETNRKLFESLATEWDTCLHDVVVHADQPPIPDPPKRPPHEKWSCQYAGVCLCGEDGDDKWAFKLWLCQKISRSFPTKSSKSNIDDGNIVVRLQSSYQSDCEGSDVD